MGRLESCRFKEMLIEYQQGTFAHCIPYTKETEPISHRLAEFELKTIATMHGSKYVGYGKSAILNLMQVMKDVLAGSG